MTRASFAGRQPLQRRLGLACRQAESAEIRALPGPDVDHARETPGDRAHEPGAKAALSVVDENRRVLSTYPRGPSTSFP